MKAADTVTCLAPAWTASALGRVAYRDASRPASENAAHAGRRENPSHFRDPEDGQIDLSDLLARFRGFLPTAIVITRPRRRLWRECGQHVPAPRGLGRPNISAFEAPGEGRSDLVDRLVLHRP